MEIKKKIPGNVFSKYFLEFLGSIRTIMWLILALMVLITCFKFSNLANPNFQSLFLSTSDGFDHSSLKGVLERASMDDKTVIIVPVNAAWTAPNSIFDLFLESFRRGNQTQELVKHIVVIAMDPKAYERCLAIHPQCFDMSPGGKNNSVDSLAGEGYFMTQIYLDLIWRRVRFLLAVVEHGYNFIFTDADILWFRNPFPKFYQDVDFQVSCDRFKGNATDLNNPPNGGFNYVISNKRTIQFYKFWYASRHTFPGLHEQDVLNKIKFDPFISKIGLKIRFLDTKYFGGLCSPSKDLNLVYTMHANCCFGLLNKVYDLNLLLQDWTIYKSEKAYGNSSKPITWRAPQKCLSPYHPPNPPKNKTQSGSGELS